MVLEFNLGKINGTLLEPLRYVHRDHNCMQKKLNFWHSVFLWRTNTKERKKCNLIIKVLIKITLLHYFNVATF
jgi:hypothetical protein